MVSSLSIKKEKGHLWDITWHAIRLSQHLPFKMTAERSRTTTLTSKAFLVVNHPEIALTLEKSLIQDETIVCFPWIERFFFMNYTIFLDIFKLSHAASTKVTWASLWMETENICGKRSVVWKNNKIWKGKAMLWKLIDWSVWNIGEIDKVTPEYVFLGSKPPSRLDFQSR